MKTRTHPCIAERTMYVAFIWTINNIVMLDLEMKNFPMTYHIAMSMDNPVIQAFADEEGEIDELFKLQGTEAIFHFRDFTSNGWIEVTPITGIEKLKGKT